MKKALVWSWPVMACGLLVLPLALSSAQAEEGFVSLFNGKDLSGWDGDPDLWSVRDGAITAQTSAEKPLKQNSFIVFRKFTLEDFELRLSYRIDGGNSGIQYRSWANPDWVVGGYQADIDASGRFTGILYEERGRGILAQRGQKVRIGPDGKKQVIGSVGDPAEIRSKIKDEGWNDYVIIARGQHLIQKINGVTTVEVFDEQKERRSMSGLLALQAHVGPPMTVQFKDIRVRRIYSENEKRIVLLGGPPSHGIGDHEHNAGMMLFAKCLNELEGVQVDCYLSPSRAEAWPEDPKVFDGADAVVIYSDGGGGHPFVRHLEEIDALAKKGVGIGCIHYAVEVPKGEAGDYFLDWIGGYFEPHWSVNPHWTMKDPILAEDHPITRGVEPFEMRDEWYFHMRFREDMKGVTPILSAVPPPETMNRPDGAHSGNPAVRKAVAAKIPQHLMWAVEREDGGRGFGFTGGHFHKEWAHEDMRQLILNAIVWIAKMEVPEGGVESSISEREVKVNLDPKGRRRR